MEARINIISGDCREELKKLDTDSIDLIFTSPPYADRRKNTYGGIHPDKYVEWFVILFTKANDTVFDPFMGFSTTIVFANRVEGNSYYLGIPPTDQATRFKVSQCCGLSAYITNPLRTVE